MSKSRILVKEKKHEARVYFDPKNFAPDGHEMLTVVNGTIYSGHCTGCDIERLTLGEMRLYFNPLYNTAADREFTLARVKEALECYSSEALLEDIKKLKDQD